MAKLAEVGDQVHADHENADALGDEDGADQPVRPITERRCVVSSPTRASPAWAHPHPQRRRPWRLRTAPLWTVPANRPLSLPAGGIRRAPNEQVQRNRDEAVDQGEDDERQAPAVRLHQHRGERQEDRRREAADDRDRQHRGPQPAPIRPAALPRARVPEPEHHHGERRLVEHPGGRDAEEHRHGVELHDVLDA